MAPRKSAGSFPAEGIPAARAQRLGPAAGFHERNSPAALDFADRCQPSESWRALELFRAPRRHGEKQLVILAAMKSHVQRIEAGYFDSVELPRPGSSRTGPVGPNPCTDAARRAQATQIGRKAIGKSIMAEATPRSASHAPNFTRIEGYK